MNVASLSTQQRDWVKQASPPWLQTGNGERFMYTIGLMSDFLLEKANQAAKIGMPGEGDVSQIPYLANDRQLVQGPAESNASFIQRLRTCFAAWKKAGSRVAVLAQLQAYAQNLQPGVSGVLPQMAIVGDSGTVSQWDTLYQDTPLGSVPSKQIVSPANFNWDGVVKPWRAWLILYMATVATGLSGTGADVMFRAAGSLPGGQNIGGVWVPATSGTPVNYPWYRLTGLSGLTTNNVGQWLQCSGFANAGNNGLFPIVAVVNSGECTIANTAGVLGDTGGTWSVVEYPWIGPAMPYGAPNSPAYGSGTYGVDVSSEVIVSIRQIVQRWKSGATWYVHIVVAFDGSTGVAGSAFSPNSAQGSGNPDGSFGPHGKNVGGVYVPTRLISSPYDAWCDGTGTYSKCSVQNVT
jgi:hypothetical protein